MGNLSSILQRPTPREPHQDTETLQGQRKEPHTEFLQVNESVWQLYPSTEWPSHRVPTVEVVFFHGLQAANVEDAYWRTWRSRHETPDGIVVWPQAWLGPRIPGARILSISYDSSAREENHGRLDPYSITENLVLDLIDAGVGQKGPVVLVGHSLGGIIIKHVILGFLEKKGPATAARQPSEVDNFLRNCKGAFYYSSPHGGSAIADWVIRAFTLMDKALPVLGRLGILGLIMGLFRGLVLTYPIVKQFWTGLDGQTPRSFWSQEYPGSKTLGRVISVLPEEVVWASALIGLLELSDILRHSRNVSLMRRLSKEYVLALLYWVVLLLPERFGWTSMLTTFLEEFCDRTVLIRRSDRMSEDIFALLRWVGLMFMLLGLALADNNLNYSSASLPEGVIAKTLCWVSTLILMCSLLGLLALVGNYVRRNNILNNPIVSLLTRLSANTAVLNREFTMSKHNLGDGGLRTRAIGESLPISVLGFNIMRVVEPESAMQDVDGGFYTASLANHFDVCKPKNNTTDPIFTYLLSLIDDLLGWTKLQPADIVESPETNQAVVPMGFFSRLWKPIYIPERRPPGMQMLNESVWQFYAPRTSAPNVDVVFFHGLQEQQSNYEEAFWKTWLARDNDNVVWPKDWLSEKLPKARILSISYVSIARSHPGWTHPSIIGGNLIQDMIDAGVGQTCPVVLVGHSLGGIIIKKIIVRCIRKKWLLNRAKDPREVERRENFVRNLRGLGFVSTPHGGSELGDYAKRTLRMKDPLITLLKTLAPPSVENSRLTDEFRLALDNTNDLHRALDSNGSMNIWSINECLPTKYLGFNGIIVAEASARMGRGSFYQVMSDHFNVCKAGHKRDKIVWYVVECAETAIQIDRTERRSRKASTLSRAASL